VMRIIMVLVGKVSRIIFGNYCCFGYDHTKHVCSVIHYAGGVHHSGSVELVVDPGNTNIMCVQFYRNGQLAHTCKLTRNEYNQEGMLNYSRDCCLV
jgi:hypothetical protein